MTWDNWFSYGKENSIILDKDKVTQITGVNGSGKSSIPVILGEIIYGKNAFGKTKSKLINRYLDGIGLLGSLEFTYNNDKYIINYSRKSTIKLQLIKNGTDISSHTTKDTLASINNIFGYEFKVLWQLIYQSSTTGLEFLTATDTNRKKFLINLFNLNQYLDIHNQFKAIGLELDKEISELSGRKKVIDSWIAKNEKEDLVEKEIKDVPIINRTLIDELTNIKVELSKIDETNKKINNNNQYKILLNELNTDILNESITTINNEKELKELKTAYWSDIAVCDSNISNLEKQYSRIKILNDRCPTCEQSIDRDFINSLLEDISTKITKYRESKEKYRDEITNLDTILLTAINAQKRLAEQDRVGRELQDLLSKIDKDLPDEVIVKDELKKEIARLENEIFNINEAIKLITSENTKIEKHNTLVKVLKSQLQEYRKDLTELNNLITEKTNVVSKISIIKKAFSTNGLLNYKIEFLIKDLEQQINTYLEHLSNGRFQLIFTLNDEKLDIEIIDDAKTIGIDELSAGELARINTATLLAIRKLMSAISTTKINVLFLDEIMGVLDDEGKDKLIDILSSEEELNTFLVSHEFSHPLIPRIDIVKENKISRIDYG